jgi:hypothetical protein
VKTYLAVSARALVRVVVGHIDSETKPLRRDRMRLRPFSWIYAGDRVQTNKEE